MKTFNEFVNESQNIFSLLSYDTSGHIVFDLDNKTYEFFNVFKTEKSYFDTLIKKAGIEKDTIKQRNLYYKALNYLKELNKPKQENKKYSFSGSYKLPHTLDFTHEFIKFINNTEVVNKLKDDYVGRKNELIDIYDYFPNNPDYVLLVIIQNKKNPNIFYSTYINGYENKEDAMNDGWFKIK